MTQEEFKKERINPIEHTVIWNGRDDYQIVDWDEDECLIKVRLKSYGTGWGG